MGSEIIPVLAQLCASTLESFSQLPHPSCTLSEELYFDTATSRYSMKKFRRAKNIHSVQQTISLRIFNPFKSAFLGLHLKWETGRSSEDSAVTSCTGLYNTTASNLFQSITYFPLESFFFFFFLLLDCF